MPRSQNDSWLQKSLKTWQRGPWRSPDLSSGHSAAVVLGHLSQLLSKEEEPQLPLAKVHVSSDALEQLCSMPQSPRFWGASVCSRACSSPACSKVDGLLLGTQLKTLSWHSKQQRRVQTSPGVQAHAITQWGTASCHSGSVSPTLTCPFCLSWIQQQPFQFNTASTAMAQWSPATPYSITEDIQTFWLIGQSVRSWKDTCMCQRTLQTSQVQQVTQQRMTAPSCAWCHPVPRKKLDCASGVVTLIYSPYKVMCGPSSTLLESSIWAITEDSPPQKYTREARSSSRHNVMPTHPKGASHMVDAQCPA